MKKFALDLVDRLSARVWSSGPFVKKTDSYNLQELAGLVAGIESAIYYTKHMLTCRAFLNVTDLLSYGLSRVRIPGVFCEFGVASGTTINHIARVSQGRYIHGFDGFVGLPEDWREGFRSGAFAGKVPAVEPNVKLHVGLFSETLPEFVAALHEDVAFLHIDCDLYSSTRDIFANLGGRIKSGTVIVFDEYMNYPGWKYHEWKAFREFILSSKHNYKYIGLVPSHQQVAVVIE